MNFDFSHLQLDDKTCRVELPMIQPGAYFVVRPAGEHNPDYQAAVLVDGTHTDRLQKAAKAAANGEKDASAKLRLAAKRDRDEDRRVFPGPVIVGWGRVDPDTGDDIPSLRDADGSEVPFTADACRALLVNEDERKQLPDWIFDIVRINVYQPTRFIGGAPLPNQDVAAVAKNS